MKSKLYGVDLYNVNVDLFPSAVLQNRALYMCTMNNFLLWLQEMYLVNY